MGRQTGTGMMRNNMTQHQTPRQGAARRALTGAALVVLGSISIHAGAALAALVTTPAISNNGPQPSMSGRFTAASGEPSLLARVAQLPEQTRRDFRFTPAFSRTIESDRAVTIIVRAPDQAAQPTVAAHRGATVHVPRPATTMQGPTMAPIAYELGSSVGVTRFVETPPVKPLARVINATTRIDQLALPAAEKPGSATPAKPKRFATRMSVSETGEAPAALNPDHAVGVDVEGSINVTRNLDVTAGLRLRRETDRQKPLTDERRDNQAVYVGTQFRF